MKGPRRSPFSILLLLVMIAMTIGSLVYTQDLEQRNSEKIFLTQESITSYEDFEDHYSQKSVVLVQTLKDSHKTQSIRDTFLSLCQKYDESNESKELVSECTILSPSDIPKEANLYIRLSSDKYNIQILSANPSQDPAKPGLIKVAMAELKSKFPEAQFAGIPYTNFLLNRYSKSIKTTIFPALFSCVFIFLLLGLKSFKEALIVFFPPLMASACSLLTTKLFFGQSTLITSIVPLLLFIINLSLILHIHHTAKEIGDMKGALKEKREPIFLMVFTTFIGFGSLYFSKLEAISHFGILSSLLFILTTFLCVLWPWALSQVFADIWKKDQRAESNPEKDIRKTTLYKYALPWSYRKIGIFSIGAIFLGLATYPKIPIITDATEYFPKHEKVKETMVQMAKDIMGTPIVEVIIRPKQGDDFTISTLNEIWEKEQKLVKKSHYQIISANYLVVMANSIYAKNPTLPSNLLAYYTLLSKSPQGMSLGYSHDEGHRITLLGGPTNIEEYEKLIEVIKENFKGHEISFNGLYYHLMVAQKQMIVTLFLSFSISLLIISLCALIYFKKIKLFFIFLAVNTIPVLGSFPLLLIIGNSFNVATVMTYSISLGLIVDSSFHIIHALGLVLSGKRGKDEKFFFKTVIIPIVQSSILLTFCFSFFSLSDFLPIREFGLSLSIVIFLGMILDLKVLPSLYQGKQKPSEISESDSNRDTQFFDEA